MDTLVRNASLGFSRVVDGYEPLIPNGEVLGRRRVGDHGEQVSLYGPKSYRDRGRGDDYGGLGLRKISRPKSYRDHDRGDHGGLITLSRPKSHRSHEHGSRSIFSRPRSCRSHENMLENSFSYRRDRARKRHIFLQSYKLSSLKSTERSKTKKLKMVAVKVKSLVVSVLSFIRADSLRSCNSRSAISASLPTRVVNCC